MSITSIKLDESAKLEFAVTVAGATSTPTGRLIIEGERFDIAYECEYVNGAMHVRIDELKGIISAGEHNAKLEVVIDGRVYTPLEETIEFTPGVEVKSSAKPVVEARQIKIDAVKVVKEESPVDERIKVAKVVAESLQYNGTESDPSMLIENAVKAFKMNKKVAGQIKNMLMVAESAGIKITDKTATIVANYLS